MAIYKQRGSNAPITRIQANRIISNACVEAGINTRLGTHTLRKTFGYYFYNETKDIALLQDILNHSAPSVTLRYIGINQDRIDFLFTFILFINRNCNNFALNCKDFSKTLKVFRKNADIYHVTQLALCYMFGYILDALYRLVIKHNSIF